MSFMIRYWPALVRPPVGRIERIIASIAPSVIFCRARDRPFFGYRSIEPYAKILAKDGSDIGFKGESHDGKFLR
jgi:hypothetical protein